MNGSFLEEEPKVDQAVEEVEELEIGCSLHRFPSRIRKKTW